MRPKSLAILNVLVYLAGILLVLSAILYSTHFHFTYTLDDPYIHLALAERLRHGLYGLNSGEAASPSSSLIWPLLLVPFAGTPIFQFVPLCLNLVFGGATAWLFGYIVGKLDTFQPGSTERWRTPVLAGMLLFAANIFGLVFTGLEHSLEVLLCVCCAYCVLQILWGERVSPVLLFAAALLPSVRYEGVLPMLAVAFALWGANSRRKAAALVVAGVAPLIVFGLFLKHLHLPAFPMSVLVKASGRAIGGSSTVRGLTLLIGNIKASLVDPERFAELLLLIALAGLTYRYRRSRTARFALAGVTLSAAAQVAAGPYGWFYRYEMYSISFALPIVIAGLLNTPALLAKDRCQEIEGTVAQGRQQIPDLLLLATGGAALFYATAFFATPMAAKAIHNQQGQMARFTSEYFTGPVAVNDLGLVALNRDPQHYVLDLVGLGSYEVFRTGHAGRTQAWLEETANKHGVQLIMIYPEWFGKLPVSWHPVARLCLATLKFGPNQRNVVFYATSLADTNRLIEQIMNFRKTLPSGASMERIQEGSPVTCPQ